MVQCNFFNRKSIDLNLFHKLPIQVKNLNERNKNCHINHINKELTCSWSFCFCSLELCLWPQLIIFAKRPTMVSDLLAWRRQILALAIWMQFWEILNEKPFEKSFECWIGKITYLKIYLSQFVIISLKCVIVCLFSSCLI